MIRFNDVSFTYGANEGQLPIRAVDHLSFHVKKGSHVALLGRNGSGKSTIARLINGLLLPDEGSVIVGGMDTRDSLDIFEIRRIWRHGLSESRQSIDRHNGRRRHRVRSV